MCRAHGTACAYPGQSEQNRDPKRCAVTKNLQLSGRKRHGAQQRTSFRISSDDRVPLPSRPSGSSAVSASSSTEAHSSTVRARSDGRQASHPVQRQPTTYEDELPALEFGSADDHALSLHIVGPAVTKDSQVLSDYLSAIPGAVTRGSRMLVPVPTSRSRPVLFHKVIKRPVGISVNRSPSAEKLEMIEKLLEPHIADVIDV